MRKSLLFLGLAVFTVLLIFACYFRIERLYGDSAYYLFQLVNDVRFVIEHNRPISYFVQFIPLLLVKNTFPIDTVILWFSINEWLFLFMCFLSMIFVFKDHKGALAILFTYLIGVRYNYFNQVSELIVAMPLVFMTYSILIRNMNWAHVLLVAIFSGVLIFSHPLYTLVVFLLMALVPLKHSLQHKIKFISIFVVCVAFVILKYLSLGQYESENISGTSDSTSISDLISHLLVYNYARLIFTLLPAFAGMFVFIVAIVIFRKKIKNPILLSVFWLFLIGYFSLVMYKYGYHFPKTFEPFERYLFLLPMVVCLLFFYFVFEHLKSKIAFVLLSLIAMFHLAGLYIYGQKVENRYNQFNRVLTYARSIPQDKLAFRSENYHLRHYGGDWIMSNESLLLTAAKNKSETKQVILYEAIHSHFLNLFNQPEKFLYAPWWDKPISALNQNYFELTPGNLHVVNTDSLQRFLPDSSFRFIELEMKSKSAFDLKPGEIRFCEITITNTGQRPLFSGMRADGICLKIKWTDVNSGEAVIAPFRSPILGDVYGSISQEIGLEAPTKNGNYKGIIGISFDDNRFIPIRGYGELIAEVK